MRLFMKRSAAVSTEIRDLLDIGRKVVEALGAHEEPFGHFRPPGQPEGLGQWRAVRERCAMMIAVAAFGIEPAALGERFKERGFAGTVLADEQGDLAAKCQVDPMTERRDRERVSRWVDLLR